MFSIQFISLVSSPKNKRAMSQEKRHCPDGRLCCGSCRRSSPHCGSPHHPSAEKMIVLYHKSDGLSTCGAQKRYGTRYCIESGLQWRGAKRQTVPKGRPVHRRQWGAGGWYCMVWLLRISGCPSSDQGPAERMGKLPYLPQKEKRTRLRVQMPPPKKKADGKLQSDKAPKIRLVPMAMPSIKTPLSRRLNGRDGCA